MAWQEKGHRVNVKDVREGGDDDSMVIQAALKALDHINDPLPVDPDLLEARKMAAAQFGERDHVGFLSGQHDDGPTVQYHLNGIRKGRSLERGDS